MSIDVKQKIRGRGRPASGHDPVRGLRLPNELWARVGYWADREEKKPNRSEAIRRLIELGLERSRHEEK